MLRLQDGRLPLHYAVEKGATLEVVELLLAGPESNATAADKARLPLCHIATSRKSRPFLTNMHILGMRITVY